MKVDNSRVFTADIYEVKNSHSVQSYIFGDVEFGSYDYDEQLVENGVIVVYFEDRNCYVPVTELKKISDWVSIKFGSERILHDDPGFKPSNGKKFLKNINRLNIIPGRTRIDDLIKLQEEITFLADGQLNKNAENVDLNGPQLN